MRSITNQSQLAVYGSFGLGVLIILMVAVCLFMKLEPYTAGSESLRPMLVKGFKPILVSSSSC